MCLWLIANARDLLVETFASCRRSCSPTKVLCCLLGAPLGALTTMGASLGLAVVNTPFGVWNHESSMWSHYCEVISKGREAYQGRADAWYSCIGEVYCCALPLMLLASAVMPVWVLLMQLFMVLEALISGFAAGCVYSPRAWWPRVAIVIRSSDELSSFNAMRPSVIHCGCITTPPPARQVASTVFDLPTGGEFLPTHAPPVGLNYPQQPQQPQPHFQVTATAHTVLSPVSSPSRASVVPLSRDSLPQSPLEPP